MGEAIDAVIEADGLGFARLSPERAGALYDRMAATFGTKPERAQAWDMFADNVHWRDDDGWRRIAQVCARFERVIVIVAGRRFAYTGPGAELHTLLEKTPNAEFYVMDDALTYAMCFSDHGVAMAVGAAKTWLALEYGEGPPDR